jgi:cytochrome d ubiquinol oxidase subunit II
MWTCFPSGLSAITTTLYVPLFLAALGILLRGGAFAFRGVTTTVAQQRLLGSIFALSSILIPFALGAAVGGVASGRVPADGNGDEWTSWLNPTSVMIGAIAVASGAYLSAVFLAGDAVRTDLPDMERAFRARALGAGIAAGALAIGGLAVLRFDARSLYDGLVEWPGLALVIASAVAGVVTMVLVHVRRYGPARIGAAVAVGAIVAGWGVAQRPDLLPGQLTLQQAAAPQATLITTVVAVGLGLVILVPSLWWLYRLFLSGQLDAPFEPLGLDDEAEPGPRP